MNVKVNESWWKAGGGVSLWSKDERGVEPGRPVKEVGLADAGDRAAFRAFQIGRAHV